MHTEANASEFFRERTMNATAERPRIKQLGTEYPVAEGFRIMAKAIEEASPLLAELSNRIADDPEILALMTSLSPGQLPTQIHGVVNYLLAGTTDEPLAAYFPCYTANPLPMKDAYPAYREFCLRRQNEVKALMATRTMQLTFPERAAPVLIALDRVAATTTGPINLIEVGCSAGLLLLFDRYHYDFGAFGQFGDPSSTVKIKHELLGASARGPLRIPEIGERLGVDLRPVNLNDADEVRWVMSSIGPERLATRDSTAKALALAAKTPPRVIAGDALKVLPEAAAAMSDPLCVMNSHCMYQWPEQVCVAFEEMLCTLSAKREVHRVSIESHDRGPARILHLIYRNGKLAASTDIGGADKWGRWIAFGA
jgi:hypothetical protein